jgi:tight adherence protein B
MTVFTIFFIVLIAAFAVMALVTEPSKTDKLIHSRLVSLDRNTITPTSSEESGIVREITFSTIPAFDRFLRTNRVAVGLQVMIQQADLQWTVGRIIFGSLMLVSIGAVLANWWITTGPVAWVLGLVCGALPYGYIRWKRNYRCNKFNQLLPEAIDLMSRGLRAGQALSATVETIAQECEDPVRSEFRRAADEQSYGLPFREAMLNLSRRVPVPDLQFLVTAVLVQKETGGNLAQILDKTSQVIRERVKVAGQIRVRTAQGRLTGIVLCALPFVVFVGLNALNPGYGNILFETAEGRKVMTYAGTMMLIGIFLIRRIVKVRF